MTQLFCRQSKNLENEATEHVYNYIINNFISQSREIASPLQRSPGESSSWKHLVYFVRNKRITATEYVDRMERNF